MNKNKICILSFSNIEYDSRVLREIKCCQKKYQTSVIGYGDWQPPENVQYIRLSKNKRNFLFLVRYFFWLILGRLYPRFYERAFWLKGEYKDAVNLIVKGNYDLVHANDWDALAPAVNGAAKSKTKVLFDAHEYSPEQGAENLLIRIFIKPYRVFLLKKYLKRIDLMIDASTRYSELYHQNFNFESRTVYNVAYYRKMPFNPANPQIINIIHHGFSMPGRFLEEMINTINLTEPRFHLYLMLVPGVYGKYHGWLIEYASRHAKDRVTFLDPVAPNEIIEKINAFDIGLPFLKVRQLSQFNSQPNKFFDYIMAGLAVVLPPLPGMMSIVQEHNIGRISASQSPVDMANLLNSLTCEEINHYKQSSLELAKEFNAEREMAKLLKIYQDVLAA